MKYVLMIAMVIMFSGCTTKVVDFIDSHAGEYPENTIIPKPKGTLVYKAAPEALKCLKDKREARGWWMMQDEIDCWDNSLSK